MGLGTMGFDGMSAHFPAAGDAGAVVGSQGLIVEKRWVDDVVVVAVSGEVDALTAPALTAAIGAARAGSSPAGVIVDLSQVAFLAAAGLGVLIAAHDEVTPTVRFGVIACGAAARSITVLGLDGVITVYRTPKDAMQDLGAG